MPPSFEFETFGASGCVSYQLSVRCHIKGFLEPDLRNSTDIVVHPRVPQEKALVPLEVTVSQEVKSFWRFFSVGSVAITGHLDKVCS